MPLSIEDIRAAKATLPKREVEAPDLGGTVWVRALTLKEVGDIQEFQGRGSKPTAVARRIVELSACNEDGSPLFAAADRDLIDGLTWGTVQAISDAATDLSGLKAEAAEAAKKN